MEKREKVPRSRAPLSSSMGRTGHLWCVIIPVPDSRQESSFAFKPRSASALQHGGQATPHRLCRSPQYLRTPSLLRSRRLDASRNALPPPPTAASTRTTFLSHCFECVVIARDNEGLSREAARHFRDFLSY